MTVVREASRRRGWPRRFSRRRLVLGGLVVLLCGAGAWADAPVGPAAAVPAARSEPGKTPTEAGPPGFAELIPRAAAMRERLGTLSDRLRREFDAGPYQERLAVFETLARSIAEHLATLKTSNRYGFDQVAELRGQIHDALDRLSAEVLRPVSQTLNDWDSHRAEWTTDLELWKAADKSLPKGAQRKAVEAVARETIGAIEDGLARLSADVGPLLELQQKVSELEARFQKAQAETDEILTGLRKELFRKTAPSLWSPRYRRALETDLEENPARWLTLPRPPAVDDVIRNGWLVPLQALIALVLAVALIRNRGTLEASPRWRHLAARPVSAGLFVGTVALAPFYDAPHPTLRFAFWILAGVSAARLAAGRIVLPARRRMLYLLAAYFLILEFFRFVGLPPSVFRLFIMLSALLGAALCFWRIRVNKRLQSPASYLWALRAAASAFLVALVCQFLGYSTLGTHILKASIETAFLAILGGLLALVGEGAVSFCVSSASPLFRLSVVRRKAARIEAAGGFWMRLAVLALTSSFVLKAWRVFDDPWSALTWFFELGVNIAGHRLTVALALSAVAVVYGAYLLSWIVQDVLREDVYPRRHLERGVQLSINRLVHYALILVGFLVAIVQLGINFSNIAFLAGAFGVGIGFGLQTIVNNFVSGIILLFERPVKVGDVIQFEDGQWGYIRRLGLRATVVETLDRSEVIVPNSDLVSNRVTNWTLTDRYIRLVITVGVVYGSDVPLTMKILHEVAADNDKVVDEPPPAVYFMEFGDNSLNFELRIWIYGFGPRFQVTSEIHQEIDRRFRAAGIEIAFPQRDLHLRSVDAKVVDTFRSRRPAVSDAEGGADA